MAWDEGREAGLEPQLGARREDNWGAQKVLRPGSGVGAWKGVGAEGSPGLGRWRRKSKVGRGLGRRWVWGEEFERRSEQEDWGLGQAWGMRAPWPLRASAGWA